MAAMAIQNDEKALLICNGYKDEEYIRLALQASLLGRTVVLVAEKLSEVSKIHEVSKKLGIKASIGIRAKLISRGSGRGRSLVETCQNLDSLPPKSWRRLSSSKKKTLLILCGFCTFTSEVRFHPSVPSKTHSEKPVGSIRS